MDRPVIYGQEQPRSYDVLWGWRNALIALGWLENDVAGASTTVVSGMAASPTGPTSLVVNLAAGRVYQNAQIDPTAYGSLTADTNMVQQQGNVGAQSVTLTTAGLSSGQSRWALIEVGYSQVDSIPSSDPTGGLLYYYNSANPATPYQGPGGSGTTQNTLRSATGTVSVVYGAVAATGTEVPPNPSAGYVPLYLIDLAFGQTTISSGQIIVAGPSVGTGVPNNYPYAPFLAGLLNSHHSGTTGQAPKINLPTETQGILPLANTLVSSALSGGGIKTTYVYAGNPNGFVAGVAGVPGVSPPDSCVDSTTGAEYNCTTTGPPGSAVWVSAAGGSLGTAASKAASNNSDPALASITGGVTVNHLAGFADTNGSIKDMGSIVGSIGSTGYQTLPGGLILQWGNGVTTSGGSAAITFPLAFPNAYFSAQATNVSSSSGVPAAGNYMGVGNATATGMNVGAESGSSGVAFNWLALGN